MHGLRCIKGFPVLLAAVVLLVAGCAARQTHTRSSVFEYLYPTQADTVIQPAMPVLNVPVRVGIAFVPEQAAQSRAGNLWTGVSAGSALTETYKQALLEKLAQHFRSHDFVGAIQVIPSAYLTPGGGFANLEQIRTMYGIDIIALVSYDQVQFTDQDLLSLTYWTLVGAYVISGEKNDTSTMLDTAVYDIASRKMLFRAPGTSQVKGRATPINVSEELRADSLKSFDAAAAMMIDNLDVQLERFREDIKRHPGQVQVVERPGYSGGGAAGLPDLLLLVTVLFVSLCRRRLRGPGLK